ncbi:MAG: nitrate reductase subunit alpha [Dehalococcoidales bacterium]|jgi:nitrate reductase alpha subunit|nr:nitrate reductase subunit alpha [Dehalococcoidales bacterium]MDP6632425.1 nitrate reductase subunit alpha [Dehalococcoidales bacterium]
MSWIQDIVNPQQRAWEDFYRNRWEHDKVVRSTHGVNCTGGCSWNVYVKNGIITWETQALDYPDFDQDMPPYEPRGCQRGISFSWYIYSPIRVKYPYIRGPLVDLWREARQKHNNPIEAWASVVENSEGRASYQRARGKGGFRRASWDEAKEIIAASMMHTAKKHGPDRIAGFSPIPAMSYLSYGGGSRLLQLFGGVNLSFYDWYCDLPPASPEIWGEQTDVQESIDWFHAKYVVSMGSNLNMTRTPDVHFVAEGRYQGAKFTVLSPDFSQVSKYSDWWIPLNAGQDGAFWMAANHVILKEFYVDRQVPYFVDYLKQHTDSPFLVALNKKGDGYEAGKFIRAKTVSRYKDVENGDWKFVIYDTNSGQPRMPKGAMGDRWATTETGKWNTEMKDGLDDAELEPILSFIDNSDEVLQVDFSGFEDQSVSKRGVPVKYVETEEGKIALTTVFDLMMARFGVGRGLAGDYAEGYDDEKSYSPAWQERFTGIDRETIIKFAREFAGTAENTEGKCTVIIGAGINHWYHNNLIYRSAITGLMLTGCIGRNGGGLAHYVGQEKLAAVAPWSTIAFANDWVAPPRLQNAPSYYYTHTDQWRYEGSFNEYAPSDNDNPLSHGHTMDMQVKSVRMGWMPFYPQFNRNPFDLVTEAKASGAETDEDIIKWLVAQLKDGKVRFAVEDPDAPENWPRMWIIWRGNAIMSSAKGHEYFLRHFLGTSSNAIAEEKAENAVSEVEWRPKAPEGKMDLVIDINFRMDTSALYSDIVLPTATWYEKDDLNSTDLHTYMHPLSEVVPPCWESKTDWEIFKLLAKTVSELAQEYAPEPIKEIVATPLQHDSADEIAQTSIKEWSKGECEPVPGKTMPHLRVVERDYANLYQRFISFGPMARQNGVGAHGVRWGIEDLYDELVHTRPTEKWNGNEYPSLNIAKDAANIILQLAPETNGESAYRSFRGLEKKVGLPLADMAEKERSINYTFMDIQVQPQRLLTSPCWSAIINDGRTYSPFSVNVERRVPWRTLTGRQQFYHDHELYLAFGEHLPVYKLSPTSEVYGDFKNTNPTGKSIMLNYLTPHGKWHIHSTYYDNELMLTLSRGIEPFWISEDDANEIGIKDNDWVEIYNDHGVVVTRAVISARVAKGTCIFYHSPERTISVPKSPLRNNMRAGGHNSLTRTRLKPILMAGGYGQFTYGFNYWGPTGVNRDTHILVRKLEGEPTW